jgi:hypothetical protein
MRLSASERQILQHLHDAVSERRLESMGSLATKLSIGPLLVRTTVLHCINQGYIGEQALQGSVALYITEYGEAALVQDRERMR